MTGRLCGKRERRGLESMNLCMIKLQEALRREKTANRTRYTHSFSRLLRTSCLMASHRVTFSTGSHFFQRAPSLLRLVLLIKSGAFSLNPGCFFLFPPCVISLQESTSTSTTTRGRGIKTEIKQKKKTTEERVEEEKKMKVVLDICLIFLMLHTPGVLSLSTRKLHTDVHRCAKSWS